MKRILLIAIIAITSTLSGYIYSNKQAKVKIDRLNAIIGTKEIAIDKHASMVHQWEVKYSNLDNAFEKSESMRSETDSKLAKAYSDIERYKRKEKDLISYTSIDLSSTDTMGLEVPVPCERIEPIKTKHIELSFIYDNNSNLSNISYLYTCSINTVVMLSPKKKKNGKEHLLNWGFLWGWETNSITTVDDDNATISNQVSIKFVK